MDETTTGATETLADSGTQPPAGTAQSQADDANHQQPESISLDEARKLRSEAKSLRARLKELEDERSTAAAAQQTDAERNLKAARKAGGDEVLLRVQGQLRRSGVKSALVAAGVNAEVLDLATKDDVFSDLSVTEEGEVEGLDAAVAALKKARPSLFTKSTPGDFGGGNRGGTPTTTRSMDELLRAAARG